MILEDVANERKQQMKSTIESQKENVQRMMNKIAEIDEQFAQAQAARVKRSAQVFVDKIFAIVEVAGYFSSGGQSS